jgi:hypothetical protein
MHLSSPLFHAISYPPAAQQPIFKPEHPVFFWIIAICELSLTVVAWRQNWGPKCTVGGNHDHLLRPRIIAAALYVIALDFCFSFMPILKKGTENSSDIPAAYIVMFGLLTLLPPIYFFFEATALHGDKYGNCDDLKTSQELASRVWAAATVLLGLYWFHDLH